MKNKKTIILSVIASLAILTLIIGATYAYFQASGGTGTSANVNVLTYTTDRLDFQTGNDVIIYADATTFASGMENASGSTFAKAILTANNKTNEATKNYYLYLDIENNNFIYTQNEDTPELLLTITDESGNPVTDITSLSYKTVTDGKGAKISGYDITNKSGLVTLFDKKEIVAKPTKTDIWNVTITLINYDKDQSNNMGKNFKAKLMIQQEEINGNILANYVISQYTGVQGENNIYHHDGTLENGINDGSYRYAGPSDSVNNFVCFGSTESPCPEDNLYRIIGVFNNQVKLIKYDYANSNLLGTDGDYVNSIEPNTTYYKGKLSTISTYYWNYKSLESTSNTWNTSLLNKTNLNTNLINNIGSTWANKIAKTAWKVGGATYVELINETPSNAFKVEVGSNASPTTYNAKVGLIYASDYYYAASPSAWKLVGYSTVDDETKDYRAATNNNWMYMGNNEWSISPTTDFENRIFAVGANGGAGSGTSNRNGGVRPVFNLESTVTYVSGAGIQSDPIRIN